jgi:hypothetical protein
MPMGRYALAGTVSGAVSALLCWALGLMMEKRLDLSFAELNFLPVTLACLVSNLLGAVLYMGLERHVPAPRLTFAFLALAVALFFSAAIGIHPLGVGFAQAAAPLHFVAALTALLMIPVLVRNGQHP